MNKLRRLLRSVLFRIRADHTTEALVALGLQVGRNFNRLHGVILDPAHCWLISIGDNVTMAPRVHVLAHDASTFQFLGFTRIGRVRIGSNVFIGADSVVLPGVTVGDNVIIGANSTVSRDIPPSSVAVGSPARVVASLEAYLERARALMKVRPTYGEEFTLRGGVDAKRKSKMIEELSDGPGYVV